LRSIEVGGKKKKWEGRIEINRSDGVGVRGVWGFSFGD